MRFRVSLSFLASRQVEVDHTRGNRPWNDPCEQSFCNPVVQSTPDILVDVLCTAHIRQVGVTVLLDITSARTEVAHLSSQRPSATSPRDRVTCLRQQNTCINFLKTCCNHQVYLQMLRRLQGHVPGRRRHANAPDIVVLGARLNLGP